MENREMQMVRSTMVRNLALAGISSGAVLAAMTSVPRHLFVSEALRYRAYDDSTMPIGFGQTLSRPSIIARMVQALSLTGEERVLEIGTGSGYQSAILGELAKSVVSMERIPELSMRARSVLVSLGYVNISFIPNGEFLNVEGSFDRIIVSAGAAIMPAQLLGKLNPGGIMIIPVQTGKNHQIRKFIRKSDGGYHEESLGEAFFVPLVGAGERRNEVRFG